MASGRMVSGASFGTTNMQVRILSCQLVGCVVQLEERLAYIEEVKGSTPFIPITRCVVNDSSPME